MLVIRRKNTNNYNNIYIYISMINIAMSESREMLEGVYTRENF